MSTPVDNLAIGEYCEIFGLVSAPQHNGKCCTLESFSAGRFGVRLEGEDRTMLSVKTANLARKGKAEAGAAQQKVKVGARSGDASSKRQTADAKSDPGGYVCAGCGKDGAKENKLFTTCPRCRSVLYCSDACNRQNWPKHKKFCKENEPALKRFHRWAEKLYDAQNAPDKIKAAEALLKMQDEVMAAFEVFHWPNGNAKEMEEYICRTLGTAGTFAAMQGSNNNRWIAPEKVRKSVEILERAFNAQITLRMFKDAGDTCANLASYISTTGDLDTADKWINKALRIAQDNGIYSLECKISCTSGGMQRDRGNYEKAVEMHQHSFEMAAFVDEASYVDGNSSGPDQERMGALIGLFEDHMEYGQADKSEESCDKLIALAQIVGDKGYEMIGYSGKGRVALHRHEWKDAQDAYAKAVQLGEEDPTLKETAKRYLDYAAHQVFRLKSGMYHSGLARPDPSRDPGVPASHEHRGFS